VGQATHTHKRERQSPPSRRASEVEACSPLPPPPQHAHSRSSRVSIAPPGRRAGRAARAGRGEEALALCSCESGDSMSSVLKAMMELRGVRSSWLMLHTNLQRVRERRERGEREERGEGWSTYWPAARVSRCTRTCRAQKVSKHGRQ
jgi:hypothetical protein